MSDDVGGLLFVAAVLGGALWLLATHAWRALRFLAPAAVRVEPDAPAGQAPLPDALAPVGAALEALGFRPLGTHEEQSPLRRPVRAWDWALAAAPVYATLREGTGLELVTPLPGGGGVVTADRRRPVLDAPGLRTGGLPHAAPERLLRAHLRRCEGLAPPPLDASLDGRVDAARAWYRGPGRRDVRRQQLRGLLLCLAALLVLAVALAAVLARVFRGG